jgi:hypothetical protein
MSKLPVDDPATEEVTAEIDLASTADCIGVTW